MLPTLLTLALGAVVASVQLNAQDEDVRAWVASQVKPRNITVDSVVNLTPWPRGSQPNLFVILATGSKPSRSPGVTEFDFGFVILAKSQTPRELRGPQLLALFAPEDTTPDQDWPISVSARRLSSPLSIDVAPFQIRKGEFAFGVRYGTDDLGNKGGHAYEVLSLFRYHDAKLSEIFRAVTWAYERSMEDTCNSDMVIIANPPRAGDESGYFTLTSKHKRSYSGDTRNPPSAYFEGPHSIAVKSCEPFREFEKTNVHTWNAARGVYLDQDGKWLFPEALD